MENNNNLNDRKSNNNSNKKKLIIGIIILIILGLLIFFWYTNNDKSQDNNQDQVETLTPNNIDSKAEVLDEVEEKNQAPDGGGSVSLTYSNIAEIDMEEWKVDILFQNPSRSTHDLVIKLFIQQDNQDVLVASSDRIPAGYEIRELDLLEDISLAQGSYSGYFFLEYYEGDMKVETIDTKIPIEVVAN